MITKNLLRTLCIAVFSLTCIFETVGQTMMPLPSHSYNYTGAVRGYWFTAPVDFTITGLRVASQAGSGTQNIQVIKINDNTPVIYGTTSTNFTSLKYIKGAPNGIIQTVSIQITAGDKIGVLGTAGNTNSYGNASGTYNLAGNQVTLKRMGYQGSIQSSGIPNYWTQNTGTISRVEMYYETCDADITSQPQPETVCENVDAEFEIAAAFSGGAGGYRWQVDEGNGFNDITNGTHYTNATTNKLVIKNTPFNMNGHEFRCIAELGTCLDTSMSVMLTVNGLVKLDDLSKNDTTCINSVKDLEVKASGSITNYQWQMYDAGEAKYINVPTTPPYSHMGNILRINGVPLAIHDTKFRVNVTGVCDASLSSELLLAVNDVPEVAIPPNDFNAKQGQTVKFEVKATVTPAKYQWQVASPNDTFVNINEGGIYTGVKSPKLEVRGVSRVQDNFKFRCIVKTASSCVAPGDTSNFGILYVEPPVSVENVFGGNKLSLYPNPTTDELFIQSSTPVAGLRYMVLDKTGRVVLSGDIKNNTSDTRVDVSSLPANMYIIKIVNNDNRIGATMKFTKM